MPKVKHLQTRIATCLGQWRRGVIDKVTLERKEERKDRNEGHLERKTIITKGVQTRKSVLFIFIGLI